MGFAHDLTRGMIDLDSTGRGLCLRRLVLSARHTSLPNAKLAPPMIFGPGSPTFLSYSGAPRITRVTVTVVYTVEWITQVLCQQWIAKYTYTQSSHHVAEALQACGHTARWDKLSICVNDIWNFLQITPNVREIWACLFPVWQHLPYQRISTSLYRYFNLRAKFRHAILNHSRERFLKIQDGGRRHAPMLNIIGSRAYSVWSHSGDTTF